MKTFHHLIGGELVAGRRHFAVIDPATGAPFADCPDATREELDRALAAAEGAFAGAWPHDEALRRRTLGAMSEALAGQADALGRLVSQEQGTLFRALVPAGVLNVVGGSDEVGAWMTGDPRVRKISFTGSVPTGKKIMRAAAEDLKRVTLELGGNDPAVVLPDVDPAAVAERLFWGAFTNSGQICVAIKRLYVHETGYQPIVAALTEVAGRVNMGAGFEAGSELGPINNRPQFERVQELVDDARRQGGKVVAGGAPLPRAGYFYPPTLVTDVGEGVRLVDEEQFGTALPIIAYHDLEDALGQANRTHYGLGGSIWTADVARGLELAQRLECGTAWVNQHINTGALAPFGGMKWSGIGRENGRWGLDEFSDLQVLSARL